MYRKIIDKLRGKKIAILGFGREGESTYRFIRKHLKDQFLTILDKKPISLSFEDPNVVIITGYDYLNHLEGYDFLIKSPGISLKDIDISNIRDSITSQLELLLEVDRENIIGITGTKGKSTTSTLTYEVLKAFYPDVYLLGNIGKPVLDEVDSFTENTKLVIEMSSHQLEFVRESPHIALILNLYQDHLDHAGSLHHYHENKLNIFRYQKEGDFSIYSDDNIYLHEKVLPMGLKSTFYTVRFDNLEYTEYSTRIEDKDILIQGRSVFHDDHRKLIGDHNLKNIMFVLTIAHILHLDMEKVSSIIKEFKGLKYRMEYIGKYHGISFYNDTIATIPEASIHAILGIGDVDTLIFGGLDRGIDYSSFVDFLNSSSIQNFVCMPTTGTKLGKLLDKEHHNVFFADTLLDAYRISLSHTRRGRSCLLSPAAASYDYFKNFEEKGEAFEKIVKSC